MLQSGADEQAVKTSEISWQGHTPSKTISGTSVLQKDVSNDQLVLEILNENCLLMIYKCGSFQLWRCKNEKFREVAAGQLNLPQIVKDTMPKVGENNRRKTAELRLLERSNS